MTKAPSMKRLAVADRFTKRLKYLEKKGIDTSAIKTQVKTITGVKITNKGNVSIAKDTFATDSKKITQALEDYIPTTKAYKKSKWGKRDALKEKLIERADEVSAKFGFDKNEFLRRAESVEGISFDEKGDIQFDMDVFDDKLEEAALKEVYSAEELMDEAKNKLIEEEGLSEGDVETLSEDRIKKKAVGIYMWEDERSVFKKYYDYVDKETHLAKNRDHYKENKAAYDKAQKGMSELGKLLSKNGFKSKEYQEKRIEIEGILNSIK